VRERRIVKMGARPKQSGLGLIEVLIAVLVLSVGFLAAAKMQIEGMRYSQNAYFLSQANFMLRDMTDRMRANRDGVLAGHYDNFTTNDATAAPGCYSANTPCTPNQIAENDLHQWSQYLYAADAKPLLPSLDGIDAKGEILFNATTSTYTVNVKWGETYKGTDEEQVLSVLITP